MAEQLSKRISMIESAVGKLQPSSAMGACMSDSNAVIEHLTRSKLCQSGKLMYMTPRDFDSPSDLLTIFALQAGGFTQVPNHYVAFMDGEIVVDLGRNVGDRVFTEDAYYTLIARLQR